jgi:asparagine synthase (glutamine-hydrolysing)
MCGITGFINSSYTTDSYPQTIKGMLAFIKHRGPDEMGYYFDDTIAIASARLSIIDITSGQQPMSDAGKRFWICFNGEIYNYIELRKDLILKGHSFGTQSDTEVLLKSWMEWGPACLPKLNGGFAFALYDKLNKSLILARDRYGKRPLFYSIKNKTLIFGSELKSFLAFPDLEFSLDPSQLSSIFSLWTPTGSQTAFKGIQQLPVASYLRFENNDMTIREYSPLKLKQELFTGDFKIACEITKQKLEESVKLRLRSDVEVGTYLSGGLDSSITTKLAIDYSNKRIKSFSISFADTEFDEQKEQNIVSQFLGTEHNTLQITNKDIVDNFPRALWYSEVPVFRTAFVPMFLLSNIVRKAGIKVVLTGEGADESFLGYDIFKETSILKNWNDFASESELKDVLKGLYPYIRHFNDNNVNSLYSLYSQFTHEKHDGLFSHEMRIHNSMFSLRLLNGKFDPLRNIIELKDNNPEYSSLDPIKKAQWLEFNSLLSGYLLSTQGDRMSMAHGVENRCPFLDFNVVEWAACLPQDFKLGSGFSEKYILKRTFQDVLPFEIINRPKQPYRAPDANAFLNNDSDWMDLILSDNELNKIDSLNFGFCKVFMSKMLKAPADTISQRENQTFVFLLSVAVLNHYFVNRKFDDPESIDSILKREIDGRTISIQ